MRYDPAGLAIARVVVVVAVCGLLGWLGHAALTSPVPFDEDEAAHANAALAVWQAGRVGDVRALAAATGGQGYYPPVHSLLVATSYALGGATLAASRVPSVVFLALALAAVALAAQLCARRLGGGPPPPGEVAAAAPWSIALITFATSPIVAEHSVLCMLELLAVAGAGAVFLALTPVVTGAATGETESSAPQRSRWLAAGALVSVLGIGVKYSFGLIEVCALGAAALEPGWSRAPWRRAARPVIHALTPPVVGFVLWLMVTDRSEVRYFFLGHPSYAPMVSVANLSFYPRAWLESYFVSRLVAVAVLLLAVVGARVGWRSAAVRFATFVILVSWVMLTASTTNEARHGILMVPSATLLASVGLRWLASRISAPSRLAGVIASVGWEALVLASAVGFGLMLPGTVRSAQEGLPEYDAMEAFVSRRVAPETPLLANGLFDQLGVDGLRWRLARDHPDRAPVGAIRIGRYPIDATAASMAARRGFAVDPLWADPELSAKSFDVIARSGRFRYVVQIIDRAGELPNARWAEVAEVCRPARVARLDLGRWTVLVADLARLAGGDDP
ncbi:MAG: hypothetical protein IPK07_04330 [Deltaproteobacteria bacterium]|nr:hypothetical protein [Deltaproteobacteria bacterium]